MDRLALRVRCGANSPSAQVDRPKCSGGERGQANDREGEAEDCGAGFAAWLFAVKATVDFLTQFLDFGGIVRVCHSLGEIGQFLTGQLAFPRQFKCEPDDPGLFGGRQLFDFFDDAARCHTRKILEIPPHSNGFSGSGRCRTAAANRTRPLAIAVNHHSHLVRCVEMKDEHKAGCRNARNFR